ncbi:MAG: sigma-70 family RNA polymerase sigma factor [Opitutaceae bacterium]
MLGSTSGNDPASAHYHGPTTDQTQWFSETVQPHESALRAYLQRNFPSTDADDVIQDSYVKLLRAKSSGTIVSAKAYLFSIARNTALNLFRRRRFFSDTPVNELPEWRVLDDRMDSAAAANAHQRLELALEVIDQLPRRCREILQLAVLERLAVPEIAARLGIAESTVYVQLARGVRKCAEHLRSRGEYR